MRRSGEITQVDRQSMQHRRSRNRRDTTAGFVIDEQGTQLSFQKPYILRSYDGKQGDMIAEVDEASAVCVG